MSHMIRIGLTGYEFRHQASGISIDGKVLSESAANDLIQFSSNNEFAWKFFSKDALFPQVEQQLEQSRKYYFALLKSGEEKSKIISGLEFDRVGGKTLLYKRDKEDRERTAKILEYKSSAVNPLCTQLHKAFYPLSPNFRLIKYGVSISPAENELGTWRHLVKNGYALQDSEIPVAKLVEVLGSKELKELCMQKSIKPARSKETMISAIIATGITYDEVKTFLPGNAYMCKIQNFSEADDLMQKWFHCCDYSEFVLQFYRS